jgi:hypothetical protein
VDPWLTRARDALAISTGVSAEELTLDDAAATTLLDLASIAAHESGTRTNAPLLCYLVGRAARSGDLDTLANAVREAKADVEHKSEKEEP